MIYRARALVLLSFVLSLPLFAADKVAGTMTVNGTETKLTHVYAAPRPNPFDESKTDVYVLVADRELPADAVHDDFALMRAREGVTGFTVQITADRSIVSGQVFSPNFKKMTQFSGTGMHELEVTSMTSDRIAGTVSVPKNDFFDNVYEYAVTFDAAVTPKPKPAPPAGKPLPPGGGDPAKAYHEYRKAMKSGDLAALRKAIVPEMAKKMDEPDFKEMFPLMQELQPKDVKITGGAVDGDTATLTAETKDAGNELTYGTIAMVREGGRWLLKKESWRNRK